jgi:ribosomal protein S18 acetylase RimI-like enzyme
MIEVTKADLRSEMHALAMVQLLDAYARDPIGGGQGLSSDVKAKLPDELAQRPSACVLLAWAGARPVGLLIAFEGFSTFAGKPLLNLHDIYVDPDYRRRGVGMLLLGEAETIARQRGCCKLTLEVLSGNAPAQAAYREFGFQEYELNPAAGKAMFWQKKL